MTITEAAATVGLSRRYSYKWGSGRLTVSLAVISLVARSCGYYRGAHRAPCCAVIRGARGDPERARETSPTLPSATRAARAGRKRDGVSWHTLLTQVVKGTLYWVCGRLELPAGYRY